MVSGSRDATLRVWNIETGECISLLHGHQAAVRCVQFDGSLVVSGAYDFTVRVWEPDTGACLHTLEGHTNRVYSLQVRVHFSSSTSYSSLCSDNCFSMFFYSLMVELWLVAVWTQQSASGTSTRASVYTPCLVITHSLPVCSSLVISSFPEMLILL